MQRCNLKIQKMKCNLKNLPVIKKAGKEQRHRKQR
jgi:hypothetical protein